MRNKAPKGVSRMRIAISEKLREIESKEHVKIIMAVESGSRAWGFESPDSDYDVRFIYVHSKEEYLRLDEVRDVIEWQLDDVLDMTLKDAVGNTLVKYDDVLDINGWDVKKALQLLYKSNPTVFEWRASPIIYRGSAEFERLKELLPVYFSKKKGLYYYLHMAETNYREYLKTDEVRIKKYFYVLRPLLAAKWILDYNCPPPMLFSELMREELDAALKSEVDRLLKMKREFPEMGVAPRVQILNDYIECTMEMIKKKADETSTKSQN